MLVNADLNVYVCVLCVCVRVLFEGTPFWGAFKARQRENHCFWCPPFSDTTRTNKQTSKQANKQTTKQTNKQTNKQTESIIVGFAWSREISQDVLRMRGQDKTGESQN